jgi:hypothetical protein
MMAKSDGNRTHIEELTDAIQTKLKAIQVRRKAIHDKTDAN